MKLITNNHALSLLSIPHTLQPSPYLIPIFNHQKMIIAVCWNQFKYEINRNKRVLKPNSNQADNRHSIVLPNRHSSLHQHCCVHCCRRGPDVRSYCSRVHRVVVCMDRCSILLYCYRGLGCCMVRCCRVGLVRCCRVGLVRSLRYSG